MRSSCLLVMMLLLAGCTTAIKQDGRCLASLTPEFFNAQEELAVQERTWNSLTSHRNRSDVSATHLLFPSNDDRKSSPVLPEMISQLPRQIDQDTEEAYRKLKEARLHYQSLFDWYEKVYGRLRMRLEEAQILSETFVILLGGGPAIALYPIVRWNIRSVIWDGADPDAESDPITRYCTERLSQMIASADPKETRFE